MSQLPPVTTERAIPPERAARAARSTAPAARPTSDLAPPVLVEVHRGETVESRHRGHVVEVDGTGRVIRAAGSPEVAIMLRSTVKPFAAVALVESGAADDLGLAAPELAILASSHTGEDKHVRTLQAIFRRANISQGHLRCGTEGAPIDAITATRLSRDGEVPGPIRHNCSGFHAASLLMSAHAGWSLDDYTDPAHPSQVAVRETVARVLGVAPTKLRTSPDDCGLLTYEVTLVELARAYLLLAAPERAGEDGRSDASAAKLAPSLRRIRDAMIAAPDMVGGTYDSLDTQLMRRRPGRLVSKGGADGVRAIGFVPAAPAVPAAGGPAAGEPAAGEPADGRPATEPAMPAAPGVAAGALAIKIEDGDLSRRAIKAASVEALAQVGILDERDLRQLAPFHRPVMLTPDRREAATAVPRFELAPLGELA